MSIVPFKRITKTILVLITLYFTLTPLHSTYADQLNIPYREYSLNSIYFVKQCEKPSSSRTSSSTTATASGSTADEKIWSALKSLGFSDEITAGILGNIHNEGGASPARYEDSHKAHWADGSFDWENDTARGHGVGIVQWSGGRRVNLFKFLRDKGASELVDKYLKHPEKYGAMSGDQFIAAVDNPKDADTLYALEIEFLVDEVKNTGEYSGVLQTKTVAEAAEHFSMHFEQCNDGCTVKGSKENQERIDAAEQIYKQFTGKTAFDNGSTSGSSSLTPCDCDNAGNLIGGDSFAGAKYSFSDEELKRLWWAATAEEGEAGEEGIKTELSLFANRFESKHVHNGTPGDNQGLIRSVLSGDYASTTHEAYNTGGVSRWGDSYPEPSSEQISAAKNILNDGNRTLPVQVIEHDRLGDIKRVTNNDAEFDKNNRSEYKTGVTVIYNVYRDEDPSDPPYVFFRWANGEQVCSSGNCGDPFGWKQGDETPSQSTLTTTETGSITWTEDGWIEGGIDGFTKEDGSKMKKISKNANQDFTTDMPNTKGKGPSKITITPTESPSGSGNSGLELFKTSKTDKTSKPPHFTINVVDRKIYQHFPLYKTSGSNSSTDDGLHIAIIGYSNADEAKKNNEDKWLISSIADEVKKNNEDKWLISSFTESDLDYLSDLIRGISSATGIEADNITGPSEVASHLTKSLNATETSECSNGGSSKTGNIIADTALDLSWDCGSSSGCHSQGNPPYEPKPEYFEAMKSLAPEGTAPYDNPGGWGYGASCDRFVAIVMRYSKADENFPTGYANDSGGYLMSHPELYEEILFDGSNFEVLKPGDIFSTFWPAETSGGHIWIYVEINGEQGRADASNGSRSGRTAEHYTRTPIINDGRQYKVFRKK